MEKDQLLKQIKKAFFNDFKPAKGVEDPMHCLACNETHERYEEIESRKRVIMKDFSLCFMSVECLTSDALKYLMPRLLELVLSQEEDDNGNLESFTRQVVQGLILDERVPDKFNYFDQAKVKVIIQFLYYIKEKTAKHELGAWEDEEDGEIIFFPDYNETLFNDAEQGLIYWNSLLI